MANECNRNIVEKYIFHKLTKQGYVWEFDVDLEEEEEEEEVARNGSVVAPPPTLVRRFGGADTTGPEEEENVPHLPERRAPPQQQQQQRADPRAAAIHRVLREAGDELERLYQADFAEMSRQLYLTSTTAQRKFKAVVDELFRDGVNWGRIIAFFEFGATVCAECAGKEMTSQVDHIAGWMTEYLNGPLNSWIQDNGGWEAFVELYDRQRESVFSCSWPSIKAVFGLAALGAASLTIGAYLTQK